MTRRSRRAWLGVVIACATATCSSVASAQTEAESFARATTLYEEATRLLDARRYDEACPKLEEAVRLVPIGVGAQLALGACYEGKGRLGSALGRYEKAAALARAANQSDRAERAAAAAAAIAPRVGTLQVVVRGGVQPPGLAVTVDGMAWPLDALGRPHPVDAGVRRIEAIADGHAPFSAVVQTRDGAAAGIEVVLVPLPPSAATPTPRGSIEPDGASGSGTLRPLGIAVGGVGTAGLVLGAVAGVLAIDRQGAGEEGCDSRDFCPRDAIEARDEAFTMAALSTVGFIAGGALLTAGVVLFVVGGDDGGSPTAILGPRGGAVRGRF